MFDGLGILRLIFGAKQLIKEATEKTITEEYWNNKELIRQDRMRGVSEREIYERAWKGKYYAARVIPEKREEPKYNIVDKERYWHDVKKYSKGVADIEAFRGGYSRIQSPDEARFPCDVRDIERFKLDAEELGQAIADDNAMIGMYCFITKNRY